MEGQTPRLGQCCGGPGSTAGLHTRSTHAPERASEGRWLHAISPRLHPLHPTSRLTKKSTTLYSLVQEDRTTRPRRLLFVALFTGIRSLEQLRGQGEHKIQYRHVIEWLLRKPGAFENYRYREDLFPTSRFRMAYDWLKERCAVAKAAKEYLTILALAACDSETAVDEALRKLLETQQPIGLAADERSITATRWPPAPPRSSRSAPRISAPMMCCWVPGTSADGQRVLGLSERAAVADGALLLCAAGRDGPAGEVQL